MRRVILAVAATVAGLVALLSFKTHSPAQSVLTPSARGDTAGAAGGGTAGGAAAPGAGANGADGAAALPPGERAVTGDVADTNYGPVQIQLVLKTGKIVKVYVLEQPTSTQEDVQIGQYAFPKLIAETLKAQTARIDTVSGASYTSGGYIQSLQSALDNGALPAAPQPRAPRPSPAPAAAPRPTPPRVPERAFGHAIVGPFTRSGT